MNFNTQPSSPNLLKEQIESERRASFKGYDTLFKNLSLEQLKAFNTAMIGPTLKSVTEWAQTYRGYEDEDSFYVTITLLSGRLIDYVENEKTDEKNIFVEGIYKIIDDTFPNKAKN